MGRVEERQKFNVGSLVTDTLVGGAFGLILGPAAGALGKAIAPAASAVVRTLSNAVKPVLSKAPTMLRPAASQGLKPATAAAAKPAGSAAGKVQSPASCATNSFVPGTLVLLGNGATAPIESIKLGDVLLATDPETGETSAEPVIATIVGTGKKDLVTIATASRSGSTSSVTATVGHPLWVHGRQAWIEAGDIVVGDLLAGPGGEQARVVSIERTRREQTVHNLTVNSRHTFYVVAGTDYLLTHNCNPPAASADELLPGLPASAPKPMGLGSTGRTTPQNLTEQLAMTEVRSAPAGAQIPRVALGDPRWSAADGWVKMQQIVNGVNIHYVRNVISGAVDDFKFVMPR